MTGGEIDMVSAPMGGRESWNCMVPHRRKNWGWQERIGAEGHH